MKKIYLANILFLISSISAMQKEKTTNQDYMHNYIEKEKDTESTDSSSDQENDNFTIHNINWPSQEDKKIIFIQNLIKNYIKSHIKVKKLENKDGKNSDDIFLIFEKNNDLVFVLKQTNNQKECESLKEVKSCVFLKEKNITIPNIKSAYFDEKSKNYFILLEAAKGISLKEKLAGSDPQKQYRIIKEYGKNFAEFHKKITIQYLKEKKKEFNEDTLKFKDIRSIAHPDMNAGNLFVQEKNENITFSWIDMFNTKTKRLQHMPFIVRSFDDFLTYLESEFKKELCENFLMGIKENFKDESIEASYDWFKNYIQSDLTDSEEKINKELLEDLESFENFYQEMKRILKHKKKELEEINLGIKEKKFFEYQDGQKTTKIRTEFMKGEWLKKEFLKNFNEESDFEKDEITETLEIMNDETFKVLMQNLL